jgi:hypothetical protein
MLNPETDEMADPETALTRLSGIETALKPRRTRTTYQSHVHRLRAPMTATAQMTTPKTAATHRIPVMNDPMVLPKSAGRGVADGFSDC